VPKVPLEQILKDAAALVGADVYVAGGPNDVSTPAGIRKPDVFIVPKEVARSAINWFVELEPDPKVTILALNDGAYELETEVWAGNVLTVSEPFAVSFDPASITELE
jgi:hypothetical protein